MSLVKLNPDELATRLAAHARTRVRAQATDTGRPAAVLVGLLDHDGETHVLLTRRAEHLREHGGQYAFPGGQRDATDADAVATALREAREEVGLAPDAVRVLGLLDDTLTLTNYVVTPVVAWLPHPYGYTPDAREVALVVDLPLQRFAEPRRARTLRFPGYRRIALGYPVDGHFVWGATATILRDLVAFITRSPE